MADTQVEVNTSLVRQLISAQFPQWARLTIEPVPVDGWDNRTFRLGDDMAVRLPSAQAYAGQVQKEHRWLPKLAPLLPLAIPAPLGLGAPAGRFPWSWGVYRWLEGEIATLEPIGDMKQFAIALGDFLGALQKIDPDGGPPPGQHNFFRGGPLEVYDEQTREVIAALKGEVDSAAATEVWDSALGAAWDGRPVWVHGDVAATNLLVRHGSLSAVIDFGCSAVGDPACDLTIAWTFFTGEGRESFREALPLDGATWARARGWALWKSLIILAGQKTGAFETSQAGRVLEDVMADQSFGSG